MSQKSLANRLKFIIAGTALCGIVLYAIIIPYLWLVRFPTVEAAYWIELIYIWLSAIPCYVVLALAMKIATNIGKGRSFSESNAISLKHISTLAAVDAAYIFGGMLALLFMGSADAMLILVALVIVFAGFAVTIAAAALSHLVMKAADLQAQSDLTI